MIDETWFDLHSTDPLFSMQHLPRSTRHVGGGGGGWNDHITRNWKADQLSAPWLGWLGRTFHVWGSPGHYCWYRNPSHGACPSPQSALLSLLLGLPPLLHLLFLLPAVMDYLVSPTEHICYVRCSYCNTVLKVIPWSRRLKMNVPQQCCFWVYTKDVHQKSIRFSKLLGVYYLQLYFTSYFFFLRFHRSKDRSSCRD